MDAIVIDWDGHDLPDELRKLPPGRYVIETASGDPTAAEQAGLKIGLDELDAGEEIAAEDALRAILGAPPER
jgi:hypothetical protein